MTKAYTYARISADMAGDEHGVSSQLKQSQRYAEQRGWEVAGNYVDNDLSAYSGVNRPQFEQLIIDMAAGKVPRLIVWHIDRLCRRVSDLVRVVDAAKAGPTEIHTIKAGDIDLTNASGEMMAMLLGVFAQFESSHLSERQIASHADRASRGLWRGGRIPFGYQSLGRGVIEINPEEATILKEWSQQLRAGDTLMSIVRRTKDNFPENHRLSDLTSFGLRQRLMNPAIAGLIKHNGEITGKGSWEPIFTEAEFQTLGAILKDPTRRTTQGAERKWQGSGVYICGKCGGRMHVRAYKRKPDKPYYTCREGECTTIGQVGTDEAVTEIIIGYLSKPENQIRISNRDDEHGLELSKLSKERADLILRKDTMGTLYAEGTIDAAQLSSGSKELQRRIADVESRLDRIRKDSPLVDLALDPEQARQRWEEISPDKKAVVIRLLMDVTINPSPKGKRVPPHERLTIEWK